MVNVQHRFVWWDNKVIWNLESAFNAMRFEKNPFHMPVRKRRQKLLKVSSFELLLTVLNDITAVKELMRQYLAESWIPRSGVFLEKDVIYNRALFMPETLTSTGRLAVTISCTQFIEISIKVDPRQSFQSQSWFSWRLLLYRLSLICFWHLRTLSKNRTNERAGG